MELDEGLQKWYQDVVKTVDLSAKEKAKVTSAGAKVLVDHLQNVTKSKHFNEHRKGGVKHLSDSIAFVSRDIDGILNGHSTVGFETKATGGINHARIARFLNDGTIYIKADHFYDNGIEEAKEKVFATQAEFLAALLKKKWGD